MILKHKKLSTLLIILLCSLTGFKSEVNDGIVNYFGIPETLTFNDMAFKLSWSSHPNTSYYKQEYLPQGDDADHFNDMVLIDFIQTDLSVRKVASAQVNKIKERQKTDQVCNYKFSENPDGSEFILHFLMSDGTADKVALVEWNAYHYKPYTDKASHKGVLLFGFSHRAYTNKIIPFLNSLTDYMDVHLNALVKYPVPEIQIK